MALQIPMAGEAVVLAGALLDEQADRPRLVVSISRGALGWRPLSSVVDSVGCLPCVEEGEDVAGVTYGGFAVGE